uniref:Uncharacterized protein n=1 Tax=Rhizophora mucronata TaxID=61149 RepID=A0A2P2P0W4_RHIMU
MGKCKYSLVYSLPFSVMLHCIASWVFSFFSLMFNCKQGSYYN